MLPKLDKLEKASPTTQLSTLDPDSLRVKTCANKNDRAVCQKCDDSSSLDCWGYCYGGVCDGDATRGATERQETTKRSSK